MTGELIAGRYELEELVGSGGMSGVYRAHDRLLERKVALKILHQRLVEDREHVERFRREARAVAQLAHPNIVTVIDRGEDDGRQFIVFEYIEGENLKQIVERRGPLPIDEVLELGIAVASGLAFAHERGVVHRDVKPQNVLLNGDGRAKVTDFGIARTLDVEKGVTQTGTVLGTSNYIAPEQASGQPVDDRSDVYSLGVVLFELLTGDIPFPGESFVAVAMQHINEPPPRVLDRRPDAPPPLAQLVARMLEKDHDYRPSMDEVVAELEALRRLPVDVEEDTAVRRPPIRAVRAPRARRSRWPLLLAALGALILGASFGALFLTDTPIDRGSGPPANEPVTIEAVRSHDPGGDDGAEHESEVPNATDGDTSTSWGTSRYSYPDGGLGKEGVGIVLQTSAPAPVLVVQTTTPGFTAEIRAGDEVVSESRTVESETTFELPDGHEHTELVLWITNLGPHSAVRVTEVTAR